MTKRVRMSALALTGAIGLTLVAPTAAYAGKSGRRNTALALGAIAAYGVIKKKPAIAGLAGAGAIYSYVRSNQSDRKRRRNRRGRRGRYYQPAYHQSYGGHRHYSGCGHSGYGRASYGGHRHYSGCGHSGYGYASHRGRKNGWYKNGKYKHHRHDDDDD